MTAIHPRACFMFPGQGSQKKGMLRELHDAHDVVRETFAEASEALGYSMTRLCFEDPEDQLGLTAYTQPALVCCSTALWRLLVSKAGQVLASSLPLPLSAGHSLGEYSALVACGVLDLGTALRLVRIRGEAMQAAVPVGVGSMAAYLGEATDSLASWCAEASTETEKVEIANENSPAQIVVSGHKAAVDRFCALIKDKKAGRAMILPVSAPFHSTLMEPARQRMAAELQQVRWGQGSGTIIANVDASPYAAATYRAALLERQIVGRVRWTDTLRRAASLLQAGDGSTESPGNPALFVEIGPGNVLQGLVRKTLGAQAVTLGSDTSQAFDQLLESLTAPTTATATPTHD